jgi:SAM-dependent methyltransferase
VINPRAIDPLVLHPLRWPWPLPALACWAALWAGCTAMRAAGIDAAPAMGPAGVVLALAWPERWRRWIIAAGFPLSALALGLSMPAWGWAAAALPLVAAYPLRAWRDAPFYPTAPDALDGLPELVPLPDGARVLDAGCGLGHGLQALHAAWPQARIEGVEWSRPLALLAGWRCPWARVRRGDLWADDWSGVDLLYLFQRPETMPRAALKARTEMRRGTWLVSLAFAVPGWRERAVIDEPGRRRVWVYRV